MSRFERVIWLYGGAFVASWLSMLWGMPFKWALLIAVASVFMAAKTYRGQWFCGKRFYAIYNSQHRCVLAPVHEGECVSSAGDRPKAIRR